VVFLLYADPVRLTARPEERAPGGDVRSLLRAPEFALMMAAIFVLTFVDRSFGPILPLYLARGGRAVDEVVLLSGCCLGGRGRGRHRNQACEWLVARWRRRG